MASVLGWFAEIGQAAKYLLRLRLPASVENRAERAVAEVGIGDTAGDNTDANLKATKSGATVFTVDVNVGPMAIKELDQTVLDRRRTVVRTLFNDFWSGVHNKPGAFVERLDKAEDYLNGRLAASGEVWRLDATTRAMLGLPPRSSSPH